MNAHDFTTLLRKELEAPWASNQWDVLPDAYGPTTSFMGSVFDSMAKRSGKFTQVPELWRIDYLWFTSEVSSTPYYSGSLERTYPFAQPAVAIEHENYGHENVAAAFLRLLGVRAGLRVLVAWCDQPTESLQRLKAVGSSAAEGGALCEGDEVLAVLFEESSELPKFSSFLLGNASCEEISS